MNWVLFDCFNTLIDDFDKSGSIDGLETIQHLPVAAGAFGTEQAFREAYNAGRKINWWQRTSEVHLNVRLRAVFEQQGTLDMDEITVLVDDMLQCFSDTYIDTVRLTHGVENMLGAWSKVAKLAVVSNFFLPGWPKKFLDQLGLGVHFQFVIDSAEVCSKKPDDLIYIKALQKTGVSPEQITFVGDDYHRDVVRPRQFGMKAHHFCRFGDRPGVERSPENRPIKNWEMFRPDNNLWN